MHWKLQVLAEKFFLPEEIWKLIDTFVKEDLHAWFESKQWLSWHNSILGTYFGSFLEYRIRGRNAFYKQKTGPGTCECLSCRIMRDLKL